MMSNMPVILVRGVCSHLFCGHKGCSLPEVSVTSFHTSSRSRSWSLGNATLVLAERSGWRRVLGASKPRPSAKGAHPYKRRACLEALRLATTKPTQRGTGYSSLGNPTQLRISRESTGLIHINIGTLFMNHTRLRKSHNTYQYFQSQPTHAFGIILSNSNYFRLWTCIWTWWSPTSRVETSCHPIKFFANCALFVTENIDRYNKCRNIEYRIISWKVIGCVLKFRYLYQPLCNSFIYACSVTVFRAQVVLSYFKKWQALCSPTCNNLLCSGASLLSRNISELTVIVVRMKSKFKGRLHFYRL